MVTSLLKIRDLVMHARRVKGGTKMPKMILVKHVKEESSQPWRVNWNVSRALLGLSPKPTGHSAHRASQGPTRSMARIFARRAILASSRSPDSPAVASVTQGRTAAPTTTSVRAV